MSTANKQTTKLVNKKVKLPESSPPFLLRVLVTIVLMALLFGISIAISLYAKELNAPSPTNFDECSKVKGSTIEESYPPICVAKNGERFMKKLSTDESKLPEPTIKDGKGAFCGGIAGLSCPEGYTCKLDGNYPDAGGTCKPN